MTFLMAVSIASEALVLLIGVIRWGRIVRPLRVLTILFGVLTCLELLLYYLHFWVGITQSSVWIYHLVTLLQFEAFTFILADWEPKASIRKPMQISMAVFLIAWVVSTCTVITSRFRAPVDEVIDVSFASRNRKDGMV